MFDGMPEQFHHFITSSRPPAPVPLPVPPPPPPSSQLPPSFSLLHGGASGGASVSFPPFELYNPNSLHLPPQLQLLHQLHHHHSNNNIKNDQDMIIKDQAHDHHENQIVVESSQGDDLWTNDEVLELLRIRSSMENWFPDFTWTHVSRKLAELGFKKSPEKCKDKFEEESRHLNNNNNVSTYTKNYRFFSELEEICHRDQNQQVVEVLDKEGKPEDDKDQDKLVDHCNVVQLENNTEKEEDEETTRTKRKRSSSIKKKKFEMLKGFCEEIVNKMMSQQEDLNNKLIEELTKRDKEKVAREESWMKQETERINKEINIRAQEHAITKDRQTKIIEFLTKFTSFSPNPNNPTPAAASSSSTYPNQELTETTTTTTTTTTRDETAGKRWPRDEVLALINLRCNHYRDEKEGSGKGPLWERISKGMLELGYKRNAKRCKEKWENINKYFRKTKDGNKKRSADSRTCPYFHQLSTLYSQGALGLPENRPTSPENRLHDDDDLDEGIEKNMGF